MLSDIQKEILRLAFEKKFVTSTEILTELWGWQPRARGTQKSTIDKTRYACRHASLSRCLTRLWLRGLIEYWKNLTRYRTAITLTPEGETLARAILAETEKSRIRG